MVCEIQSTVKSATEAEIVVEVPPLVTKATHELYNLGKEQKIEGTKFADTTIKKGKAFDKLTNTIYSSDNPDCFVGLEVEEGMFVSVNKLRYMANPEWTAAASYLEGAVIEGSNDDVAWETIFEVDIKNVHSGWNYWEKGENSTCEYRYIRFSHNNVSKC